MDKTLDLHEENLKYLKLYAEGDESAAERLMELNMGLVNGIALRFRGRGTEMEDLIQIGTIGMIAAKTAGTVTVGSHTWVGIGATISNNLTVCSHCMIGAGAVVVRDISTPGTYVGVPARRLP